MDELNDNQNLPPQEPLESPYTQQAPYVQPMINQPNNIPPYQQIPPQTPYQYYYAEQNKPKDGNGMAIAAMVCGIVSIVGYCIAFPCSIVAIILGIICLKKKTNGKGMAIAGLVCGGIGFTISIAIIIFYVIAISLGLSSSKGYPFY
ncbi:MAG TPA: DUF4190 domain-containing protein [Oscillospiraceae bacterium]|nr:DUF4190 domain-containing protein [Oscillospiraceae bacterium]